jgi:hypothetical protein
VLGCTTKLDLENSNNNTENREGNLSILDLNRRSLHRPAVHLGPAAAGHTARHFYYSLTELTICGSKHTVEDSYIISCGTDGSIFRTQCTSNQFQTTCLRDPCKAHATRVTSDPCRPTIVAYGDIEG